MWLYLAKVHALDSFASECWTDWRRRRSLAGADDELDDLVILHHSASHDGRMLMFKERLMYLLCTSTGSGSDRDEIVKRASMVKRRWNLKIAN